MKKLLNALLFGLACASLVGPAWGEKADRNKPLNVESDAMRYDDLQQVTIFTGRVLMTKGTIVIRGAQIDVREDPEGYQYGLVTGSAKDPAFFRQKREAIEEFIEGEGDTIIYDGKADTVRFITNARMRRLRGATLADEVTGANILYENLTDKFFVVGTDGSKANAPKGRVRAMLTPKPDKTTPVPAATGGQPLRLTPQLESKPQ